MESHTNFINSPPFYLFIFCSSSAKFLRFLPWTSIWSLLKQARYAENPPVRLFFLRLTVTILSVIVAFPGNYQGWNQWGCYHLSKTLVGFPNKRRTVGYPWVSLNQPRCSIWKDKVVDWVNQLTQALYPSIDYCTFLYIGADWGFQFIMARFP